MSKRTKIPLKVQEEVMFRSKGLCYCKQPGDQIHHINEINTDHSFDNLVLVCFKHHDEASLKGGLKRRPSKTLIKRLRDELYKNNEEQRRIELKHYDKQLKKVSEENLLRAALDANIIMKIIDAKEAFGTHRDWEKRSDTLWNLRKYSEYSGLRVSDEIINFISQVVGYTRSGMKSDFSDGIFYLIMDFFPYSENKEDEIKIIEIAKRCSHAGSNIVYDAFIYLGNFAVASSGLEILKFVYRRGKDLGIKEICQNVLSEYSDLEHHLNRKERTDLEDSKRMLQAFKNDLDKRGVGVPDDLDKNLWKLIDSHRNKGRIEESK